MLLVFVAGPVTRGSQRWLDLGSFRFQPSEFGKLLFVLALAGFLAERGEAHQRAADDAQRARARRRAGRARVPPAGLRHRARLRRRARRRALRRRHALADLAVLGAVALVGALLRPLGRCPPPARTSLEAYQVQRSTGFLHPDADPSGATYNITQSKVAVGAGGFDGRGVAGATQTNLSYLPEHATDFVFASFAEQRGFVGAAILLCLYLLVVWRGLRIVTVARDLFSAIVAGGIVVAFLFQVFVNVGMTMGIAPITGIPLPFVSVGGSSMIANLAAMGVLLSIHAARRRRTGGASGAADQVRRGARPC